MVILVLGILAVSSTILVSKYVHSYYKKSADRKVGHHVH